MCLEGKHVVLDLLQSNNIEFVIIPPNCIYRLQPLDISINKSCKNFIQARSIEWYATKVAKNMENNDFSPINMKMSIMKPLGEKWMISFYEYILQNQKIIYNDFNSLITKVKLIAGAIP